MTCTVPLQPPRTHTQQVLGHVQSRYNHQAHRHRESTGTCTVLLQPPRTHTASTRTCAVPLQPPRTHTASTRRCIVSPQPPRTLTSHEVLATYHRRSSGTKVLPIDCLEPQGSFSLVLRYSIKLYPSFPCLLYLSGGAVVSTARANHSEHYLPHTFQRPFCHAEVDYVTF